MTVLILAGPPAVGHDTVAALLADRLERCAVIDGDLIRDIVITPQAPPGSGPDWDRHYDLSIRNACALALNFDQEGLDVVITDVVEPAVVPRFRAELASVEGMVLVLLTADVETLISRDVARHAEPSTELDAEGRAALAAWHGRIRYLHAELASCEELYDHVVDTSHHTPEETTAAVSELLQRAPSPLRQV